MRIAERPGQVLKEAAIVGGSTLIIGLAMSKAYKYFDWDVPQPVFWTLLGVWTHLAWDIVGVHRAFCTNLAREQSSAASTNLPS